jgi:hypothetical protein
MNRGTLLFVSATNFLYAYTFRLAVVSGESGEQGVPLGWHREVGEG